MRYNWSHHWARCVCRAAKTANKVMPSTEHKLDWHSWDFPMILSRNLVFYFFTPPIKKQTVFFQLQDLVHILTCFPNFKKVSFQSVEQGWLVFRTTTSSDPSTAETHFQRHSFQHGFHLLKRRRKSCLYLKILNSVPITSKIPPERISSSRSMDTQQVIFQVKMYPVFLKKPWKLDSSIY